VQVNLGLLIVQAVGVGGAMHQWVTVALDPGDIESQSMSSAVALAISGWCDSGTAPRDDAEHCPSWFFSTLQEFTPSALQAWLNMPFVLTFRLSLNRVNPAVDMIRIIPVPCQGWFWYGTRDACFTHPAIRTIASKLARSRAIWAPLRASRV